MTQTIIISITQALQAYIQNLISAPSDAGSNDYADYIGFYLQHEWDSPITGTGSSSTSIAANSYHVLSDLQKDDQGRYTFSADAATAARIWLLVPSQQQNTDPWIAPWGTDGVPNPTTLNQTSFVYAYGETNFNGTVGNMDTTYIDTFGLPYQLRSLDQNGNVLKTINAGVGNAEAVYNAAANGPNQVQFQGTYTGALVPPENATYGYHDFSKYYQYLANWTKKGNTTWLKRGDNSRPLVGKLQQFDGNAAFIGFNGKSGSQGKGYIVIGGTVNESTGSTATDEYSVLIPWSKEVLYLLNLGNLVQAYDDAPAGLVGKNFLSEAPYAYANDITGFWVQGNIFEDNIFTKQNKQTNSLIQSYFADATPFDVSNQQPDYNAPPNDFVAMMVDDLFYGLNKGMLGSTVDFVTGLTQEDLTTKMYPGVQTTMDIGALPSEAWYSNSTSYLDSGAASLYWAGILNPMNVWTGNQINGPVAQGIWGPWAWGTSNKNFWNTWSFSLNGQIAANVQDYKDTTNLARASRPLLPDTYTWAMDDRIGGQLLQFGNNDLELIFDAPFTSPVMPL